ncbi:hypothetical protein, partial [Microbacterium sp. Leaf320]|uniref:hypothetical protein n=1 Tax=Microbacterium sp. Leaf320 TaxID=1736334 RepID=UPI001F34FD18
MPVFVTPNSYDTTSPTAPDPNATPDFDTDNPAAGNTVFTRTVFVSADTRTPPGANAATDAVFTT